MSSAPINVSSRLAGTECCRPSKGKRSGISVIAGPHGWAATCTSATGADIASFYITPALWGVFSNGEWSAKGACCTRRHALRLSTKAWPSGARAVCREAETCPCEGAAAQPLQWSPAFRWDQPERRLPSWSDCCAPTIARLSGCLALLAARPLHRCAGGRAARLVCRATLNISDPPFWCDAAERMQRPIG
jgi:hypothetical protein